MRGYNCRGKERVSGENELYILIKPEGGGGKRVRRRKERGSLFSSVFHYQAIKF